RVYSRPILALGGLVLFGALILSWSRASVLTVAVSACAFVCLRRFKIQRSLIALGAALAIAAILVRFASPGLSEYYWLRLVGSVRYLGSYPNGILSGRIATWNTLMAFLLEHPWRLLFGIGYKTLPYTHLFGHTLVADNTYLSLLVETGIIGLVAFLLLNWAILRTAFRARASFFGTWIFCFWCGEIVQMLFGDLITY